jgi:diacylglycerol O-acyltransferase / wax synthase
MDRLSALDSSFLLLEDDGVSHMHVGSIAIVEGPAPTSEEFERYVAGKLPLVPRYRQKVRIPTLQFGRPIWIDDPHFNIGYHLRHTALAQPGGVRELLTLVGRVMSQRLDRNRPLWETWRVEGLEDGAWALVSKTHHCMVDGVASTDLLTLLLDLDPTPKEPVEDGWSPRPEPSTLQVLADAVVAGVKNPYENGRAVLSMVPDLGGYGGALRDFVTGTANLSGVFRPLQRSSLDGPIGPHRRWELARGSMAEVKQIRVAFGGTVNDVVLTAITAGLRSLLLARGESCEGHIIRSLVPVSVRHPEERGTYNNRVSAIFAELPVGIADPIERLESIKAQMKHLKAAKGAVAGEVLTGLTGFAPPMLLAAAERLVARVPQRNLNMVTTNVPGPQVPLYAMGRRLLELYPYVPIQGQLRIGVAIFSYDGALGFGITGDYDEAADIDVLARGIEDGMAELVKLAVAAG